VNLYNSANFNCNSCWFEKNTAGDTGGAFAAYGGYISTNNTVFTGESSSSSIIIIILIIIIIIIIIIIVIVIIIIITASMIMFERITAGDTGGAFAACGGYISTIITVFTGEGGEEAAADACRPQAG
jgi:hypothetical protein